MPPADAKLSADEIARQLEAQYPAFAGLDALMEEMIVRSDWAKGLLEKFVAWLRAIARSVEQVGFEMPQPLVDDDED